MKKISLSLLMATAALCLSGCACINGLVPGGDNLGDDPIDNPGDDPGDNPGGDPDDNPGGNDKTYKPFQSLSLPEKVHLKGKLSNVTLQPEIYKIGNDYMCVEASDVTFARFNPTNGKVQNCYGEISGGKITWEEVTFAQSVVKALGTMLDVFEYEDSSSYLRQYCEKSNEKATIAGVETVKYADEDYAYYVDETTKLVFKTFNLYSSKTNYELLSYDTTTSSFPYALPAGL